MINRVGSMIAKRYSFSFGSDKICSKIACDDGYITLKSIELLHSKWVNCIQDLQISKAITKKKKNHLKTKIAAFNYLFSFFKDFFFRRGSLLKS